MQGSSKPQQLGSVERAGCKLHSKSPHVYFIPGEVFRFPRKVVDDGDVNFFPRVRYIKGKAQNPVKASKRLALRRAHSHSSVVCILRPTFPRK